LVTPRENATHAITFALLNHRGEELIAPDRLPERLKQIFRLGGFEVLSSASDLGRKDGVYFLTLFERPPREDPDVRSSGIERFGHH